MRSAALEFSESADSLFADAAAPLMQTQAAQLYLSLPSIAGEDPTPGYPGAMAAHAVTVVPDGFTDIFLDYFSR